MIRRDVIKMQRNYYLTRSNPNFSMDLESSWAAKTWHGYSDADLSKILQKARFQQKQLEEKEEKLTQLYERQQQRTLERVVKSRTGIQRTQFGGRNNFDGRLSGETSPGALSSTSTSSTSSQKMIGNGRVRQMFAERRGPKPAGIDKSYPLAPLPESKTSKRAPNFDRTFTKDDITDKFDNLQIFQPNENGTLSPFSLIDRQNNNERLEDENFPELNLVDDDDLDASFGKLPNVVKALPSQMEAANRFGGGKATKLGDGDAKQKVNNGNSNLRRIGPIKTDVKKSTPTVTKPTIRKAVPVEKKISPVPVEMTPVKPIPQRTTTRKVANSQIRKQSSSPIKRSENTPASAATRDDLSTCNYCNRRFASDRLSKHQEICAKTTQKKRKPYDALKHRVIGTEAEAYVKKALRNPSPQPTKNKNSDWRRKHEEFIATIRAAKQVSEHLAKGGNIRDLPPPPPSSNPDYVECPHCLRKFNQGAADRHIPKCKNYSFNKKPTPIKKTSLRR